MSDVKSRVAKIERELGKPGDLCTCELPALGPGGERPAVGPLWICRDERPDDVPALSESEIMAQVEPELLTCAACGKERPVSIIRLFYLPAAPLPT